MAKKIVLSVADRLQLQTLLLRNGRMIEMEIANSIREKVRFTPQEIEEYELRDLANGSVTWSSSRAKDKEYGFEDSEILNLQKGIKAADNNEHITVHNLNLAKRIQAIKIKPKEE